jgi:DNA-binding MarR family transcriptional regulator
MAAGANGTAPLESKAAVDDTGDPELLTTEELARRLGLTPATISNRIGRLDKRHGVVRIDAKYTRINWPVFWAKLQAGEITWRK